MNTIIDSQNGGIIIIALYSHGDGISIICIRKTIPANGNIGVVTDNIANILIKLNRTFFNRISGNLRVGIENLIFKSLLDNQYWYIRKITFPYTKFRFDF